MTWLSAVLALPWIGVDLFLAGKKPLELTEKKKTYFLVAAVAVNLWMAAAFFLRETEPAVQVCKWFATNVMLMAAATDLLEMAVYDLHFRVLLLGGAVSAFLQAGVRFWEMYLLFGLLYGVLRLVSKKKQLSMGDSQIIACLALYFPLARWAEVLFLALLCAMIYGLAVIVRKKKTVKSEMPFIPFLLIGMLVDYFV